MLSKTRNQIKNNKHIHSNYLKQEMSSVIATEKTGEKRCDVVETNTGY